MNNEWCLIVIAILMVPVILSSIASDTDVYGREKTHKKRVIILFSKGIWFPSKEELDKTLSVLRKEREMIREEKKKAEQENDE